MSRESDSPSPRPRGNAAYPSGTPPYGTNGGSAAPRTGAEQADAAVAEGPKTETTLTTRIRINIPGSRPIPPVVVRSAMPDATPDAEADTHSPAEGSPFGTPGRDRPSDVGFGDHIPHAAEAAASPVLGVMDDGTGPVPVPDLPAEWQTAQTRTAGATPTPGAQSSDTGEWFRPRKKGKPNAPAAGAGEGTTPPGRVGGDPQSPFPGDGTSGSGTAQNPFPGVGGSGTTRSGANGQSPYPSDNTAPGRASGESQSPFPGSGAEGFGAAAASPYPGESTAPGESLSPFPGSGAAGTSGSAAMGYGSPFNGGGAPGSSPFPGEGTTPGRGAGEALNPFPGVPGGPGARDDLSGTTGQFPRPTAPASPFPPSAPASSAPAGDQPATFGGEAPLPTRQTPDGPGRSRIGAALDGFDGPSSASRAEDTPAGGFPNASGAPVFGTVPEAGGRPSAEFGPGAVGGIGGLGARGAAMPTTDESTGERTAPFPIPDFSQPAPKIDLSAPVDSSTDFPQTSPFSPTLGVPPFTGFPSDQEPAGSTTSVPEAAGAAKPTPAPSAKKPKKKRGSGKLAVYALVGVAAAGGVVYGAGLMLNQSDIPKGTTVLGTSIGGDSRDAAVAALDATVGKASQQPMVLSIAGKTVQLTPDMAGLTIDTNATVQALAKHSYNPVTVIDSLFTSSHAVVPTVVVDQQKLHAALEGLAASSASSSAREGEVSFKVDASGTGSVVSVLPQAGQGLDVAAAAVVVQEAYQQRASGVPVGTLTLPVGTVQPKVTVAAVQQAASTIGKWAMSGKFTVTIGGVPFYFGPHTFSKTLTLAPDTSGQLVPTFNATELASLYGTTWDAVTTKSGAKVTPQTVITALTTLLEKPNGAKTISL